MLLSRKYGVANICFTHDPASVVASSNKGSDTALRYHDLHANRFVRYFRGHTGRVTRLAMSPRSDVFLSAAEDKQVGNWGGVLLAVVEGLSTDADGLLFCICAAAQRFVAPLATCPTPALRHLACLTLPAHPSTACPQVRLWDLRANACQALLQAPGLPTTAFDEQGLVFAVGAERGVIKMYDARKWSMGPFTSFPVSE